MILWIDPGARKLWYAIIDNDLNIIDSWILLQEEQNPSRYDQFNRIRKIYDLFENLIKTYPIKKVWIEKLYFTKYNKNNAEFIYWVRWSLIVLFLKKNLKIYEFTPKEIKKFITWNWKANKRLMQQTVMKLYGLVDLPKYHDAADALWICWIVKHIDLNSNKNIIFNK